MCWPCWGEAGKVPEEMGKVCEEGFQSTVWKGMTSMRNHNIKLHHVSLIIRCVTSVETALADCSRRVDDCVFH